MKRSPLLPVWLPVCLTIAWLALGHSVMAGATDPTAAAAKNAGTNAPALLVAVIPKAAFDTNGLIRNPFFPMSRRNMTIDVSPTNEVPVVSASLFVLKGLSGIGHNRLAMINNRTFGEGESGEVPTHEGKARIRCITIGNNTATIRVDNQAQPIVLTYEDSTTKPTTNILFQEKQTP